MYPFEQKLHLHRVLDSILDNRTDMALVRIVMPVSGGRLDAADALAIQVAQLVYPFMLPYFPVDKKTISSLHPQAAIVYKSRH